MDDTQVVDTPEVTMADPNKPCLYCGKPVGFKKQVKGTHMDEYFINYKYQKKFCCREHYLIYTNQVQNERRRLSGYRKAYDRWYNDNVRKPRKVAARAAKLLKKVKEVRSVSL